MKVQITHLDERNDRVIEVPDGCGSAHASRARAFRPNHGGKTGRPAETPSPASEKPQIRIEKRTPAYWRVTFDNPPFNIFGPETIPQMEKVVEQIEADPNLRVVVFDSAVPGFFLTHYNFPPPLSRSTSPPLGRPGSTPAGHARSHQQGARCLHRPHPRASHRRRQRIGARQRHAVCQQGECSPFPNWEGRSRFRPGWWSDGAPPASDGPRPCARSASRVR